MPGQGQPMQGQPPGTVQKAAYPAAQMVGPGASNWAPQAADLPGTAVAESLLSKVTQLMSDRVALKKLVLIAGIATLIVTVAIPLARMGGTTMWAFSEGTPKFRALIWPLLAGGAFLFTGLAPPNLKQSLPGWVWFGVPLSVAGLSMAIVGWGGTWMLAETDGIAVMLRFGFPILIAGLLLFRTRGGSNMSRALIGVGGGFTLIYTINFMVESMFKFSGNKALLIIHNLLFGVVLIIASIAAAISLSRQVPQLRVVERFVAPITALLIVAIPAQIVLMFLVFIIHLSMGVTAVFILLHQLVYAVAFAAVFVLLFDLGSKDLGTLMSGIGGGPAQQPYGQWPGQPGMGQPGQPGMGQPQGNPIPQGAPPAGHPGANQGPAPAGYPGQPGPAPAGYPSPGPAGPGGPTGPGGNPGQGGGGWPPSGGGQG